MKSTIKKSIYRKNLNKTFFIVILFFVFYFFSLNSFSQTYRFEFKDTPLSKALTEIAQKTNIRLSFDSDLLEEIKTSLTIRETEVSDILTTLLKNTEFTFDYKYNTYLIYKKRREPVKSSNPREKMLTGIVFDEESGERLPYATIYIRERNQSVSTTVEGTFSIRASDSIPNFIQVKYLGYQNLDTVINTSQEQFLLRFGLTKKTQTIETVNVSGDKLEMVDFSNDAGHVVFNPSKFADLPNYGETDVFRALQLLPGISSFENSSQLNIRGSSADQNLVLLDGFTLYNLDHFFGVFSALNPNVIKNIQVYRGGFDSRYGERISAIVDITGKSGNQTKPEFYGGINLISGNLTAEIPISKKLTLVAAGRRAYSDVYSTWLADELLGDKLGQTRRLPTPDANVITPEFFFSDYNLKLSYRISEQENLSFSAYGAKDNLNSSGNNSNDRGKLEVDDMNEWGNYGLGTTWNKQWNGKYFTRLQFGHSGYLNDYNNSTTITLYGIPPQDSTFILDNEINEVTNESNELTDYFLTFRNEYLVNSKNRIEFGLSAKYNKFTFYKDATRDFIYDNLKSSALLYTVFFQDKINLGNQLALKPGVRLNYYGNSEKFYLEPRLTGSYSAGPGITLKMATGKYYQYLNKSGSEQTYGYNRSFWVLADGEVYPVLSANHYIAGVSFEINDFYFDAEAYYKTIKGLQEYLFFDNPGRRDGENPPAENTAPLSSFISGKGKALGIDFLAKYEGPFFTSWLAYSLSKATRNFDEINNGKEIPSNFDQTHEFKWTNIYNYHKWNFSTLTIFTTGKPYIESSSKDENFNTTRIYNRLPNYFRVDFSMNYNFNIKNVNIKPGMSVLNAFNTENYLDIYTRVFDVDNNPFNETTLVKAQNLTFNFFINFRF